MVENPQRRTNSNVIVIIQMIIVIYGNQFHPRIGVKARRKAECLKVLLGSVHIVQKCFLPFRSIRTSKIGFHFSVEISHNIADLSDFRIQETFLLVLVAVIRFFCHSTCSSILQLFSG